MTDLDLKGRCSAVAYGHTQRTFATRAGKDGAIHAGLKASFSSLVQVGDRRVGISSDGIGTKIEVAERMGDYSTLGFDLVAMVADDLAANGIEPTNLSNILDVDRLDESTVEALLEGLAKAAVASNVALTGGEIAELGSRVSGWGGGMHFNWCATAIGVLPSSLAGPIDGSAIRLGDRIVAIQERGLRSNGFSLARKILGDALGGRWHESRCAPDGRTWGEVLLTPSTACCGLITRLVASGNAPHGIAHLTGGGIPEELGRILAANGLGASLDRLFDPPAFVQELRALGEIGVELAYRHWNMGQAMLLVVDPVAAERVVEKARESGLAARIAGDIESEPVIQIVAHGEEARFEVGRA